MSDEPEEPIICGARAAKCMCMKPEGHDDDVHECGPECGGAWAVRDGEFVVIELPGFPGLMRGLRGE